MSGFLPAAASFAVFATFLGGVIGGVATLVYKFVIVPSLNAHINAIAGPIKTTVESLAESVEEIRDMTTRNGHQEGKDPSIRDQLSTLVALWGEHKVVADADHALLAKTVEEVRALRAVS